MLQLQRIHKTFNEGTADERRALDDVNLTLDAGDFITVIGSNGAGKSTLMNVIAGVLKPDYGEVLIDSTRVTSVPEFRRSRLVGHVFQDPLSGTAPTMTVEENMALAYGRSHRRTLRPGVTRRRRSWFREQLATLQLGLEDRLNAHVGLLSGGERQAMSLLMATFTEPIILLLDEHTAALDPSRAALITEITQQMVENTGLTTVMVTHNMQQAIDLGNRLLMMDRGRFVIEFDAERKAALTVQDLIDEFQQLRGADAVDDRTLLT